METQLKRQSLINRKKLNILELSIAGSDGTCAFKNSFYSKDLEFKNNAIKAYYFHKDRMLFYPYSQQWVNYWEHAAKNM